LVGEALDVVHLEPVRTTEGCRSSGARSGWSCPWSSRSRWHPPASLRAEQDLPDGGARDLAHPSGLTRVAQIVRLRANGDVREGRHDSHGEREHCQGRRGGSRRL